jgi:hypothetical protein
MPAARAASAAAPTVPSRPATPSTSAPAAARCITCATSSSAVSPITEMSGRSRCTLVSTSCPLPLCDAGLTSVAPSTKPAATSDGWWAPVATREKPTRPASVAKGTRSAGISSATALAKAAALAA